MGLGWECVRVSSKLPANIGTPGLKAALRTLLKGLHYSGAFFPSPGPLNPCLRASEVDSVKRDFWGFHQMEKPPWFSDGGAGFCFVLFSSFSQKMHLVGWGCGSVNRTLVQTAQGSAFSVSNCFWWHMPVILALRR